MTIWALLDECVQQLDEPFRRSEIVGWFRRHHPEVLEQSLNAHIQGATAGAPGRGQLASRAPLLERIDRGLYRRARAAEEPVQVFARARAKDGRIGAVATQGRVAAVLVGCVKGKRSTPAPAVDLYTSPLFVRRRAYAQASGLPWFVLSAEHGLVRPEALLEPYDRALADQPAAYRDAWGAWVAVRLEESIGGLAGRTVEVHAGSAYVDALRGPLERRGCAMVLPLHGLRQGEQLAWYDENEITLGIYRRVPVLLREGDPGGNPWGLSFMQGLFNMTSDSGLFHTRDELEAEGWTLEGNTFVRGTHRMLPLYEAKMLHHYDHRWATYEGSVIRDVTHAEKDDPAFVILPRYWVPEGDVDSRLGGRWDRSWLLGWRNICRSTDERTTIAFSFPMSSVGHSTPLLVGRSSPLLLSALLSFTLDYVSRQKVGGTNFTFNYFQQLAMLRPVSFEQARSWLPRKRLDVWVTSRIVEMTWTAWDMEAFARDLGDAGPPFRWDSERRALIRAELDAAMFHLYGLPREDVDYIMDTFPIVRRKDEAAYGEYRTKRLILDVYDAMAEAIRTGVPYQSVLDPEPGRGPRHPESSHPDWAKPIAARGRRDRE